MLFDSSVTPPLGPMIGFSISTQGISNIYNETTSLTLGGGPVTYLSASPVAFYVDAGATPGVSETSGTASFIEATLSGYLTQ
jgi:hypothetical protein